MKGGINFLSTNLILLTLISLFGVSVGNNKTLQVDDYQILVVSPSGEIRMKNGDDLEEMMVIRLVSIEEYTESGIKIAEHSIDNFAETEFDFTGPFDEFQYGLNAFIMTYQTDLVYGELTVETTVFKESGVIQTRSGEIFDVTKGTVLFTVSIINWDFCGIQDICENDQVGEYLALTMESKGSNHYAKKPVLAVIQKGKKGTSISNLDPITYYMGSSEIILSNLVLADNVWRHMADGYPLVKMNDTSSYLTITSRLYKFNDSISYKALGLPVWKHTADGVLVKVNVYYGICLLLLVIVTTVIM